MGFRGDVAGLADQEGYVERNFWGGVSLQSGAKILVLSGVMLLALLQEITRQGR